MDVLQTQGAQCLSLVLQPTDPGSGLGHFQTCHQASIPAARARSMAAGATCSRGRPRRAATSSGRSRPRSAATVAWTTLMALSEPSDLDSTSLIPAHSSTARTGPPAMTPVPGAAGRSRTTPAAASPWTGCGIVPWMRGTLKNSFLASSTPLAMAAGTSLALPYPTPTVPSPSPTTTSAVKLKRRPPLTTLETRLMVTTRSTKAFLSGALSRPRLSRSRPPPRRSLRSPPLAPLAAPAPTPVPRRWGPGIRRSSSQKSRAARASQGQTALACTVSERGDAAVVTVAAAVKDDRLDARALGPPGEQLANLAGLGGLVTIEGPQVRFHARGRGHCCTQRVVDDLYEDVPARTRHDQAGTQRGAVDPLAHAQVTTTTRCALALGALDDQCHCLLTSLSDLAADLLACVANALTLVRVGLAQLANVCGDLADELLVDALDRETGGVLDGEGDALGRLDGDRVAVAECELQVAPLDCHAITRAVDLQLLLVALGDAEHHVVDQRAGQAVQRAGLPLVVGALDLDASLSRLGHRDRRSHKVQQLALRAFDRDSLPIDGNIDT